MNAARLNVLMFTNTTVRAGVEEHVLTLLHGLDREKFRLHLACPPVLVELFGKDIPADVTVIPLLLDKPTQMKAMWSLATVLRRYQISVLHTHLFYSSLFSVPIAWFCRVPLIVETTHVRESWRKGLKASYVVDRLVAQFVDRFIAVSEANAEYLIQDKRVPRHKVAIIRNGVNLKRFQPKQAPGELKRSLGFEEDDPVLVAGARLEPQKGHAVLLRAMKMVVRRFPRTRLVCVGDGSLRRDLEVQTEALGLKQNVTFAGFQPNMLDWLALSDIVVLPSLYEGLPLIALEALAAGRPMVATAVDGTGEVVRNEATGLLVPPSDDERLAAALCRLLGDQPFAKALGKNGYEWVRRHFSEEQQILNTETLYLEAGRPKQVNRSAAQADRASVAVQ